tara:strand:+ start:1015 stop:1218 length:204 start_codon:yes stop_codon:yes gene_type:complete
MKTIEMSETEIKDLQKIIELTVENKRLRHHLQDAYFLIDMGKSVFNSPNRYELFVENEEVLELIKDS